jgi:hypothetical protein
MLLSVQAVRRLVQDLSASPDALAPDALALHRSPAGRPGQSPSTDGLCSPGTRVGRPQPLNSVIWPSRNCRNASSVSGQSGNR